MADLWTYEQSRDAMLESPHNKLYSETTHNHPWTIRTACIISYDKNDRKKIISVTLVQDEAGNGSTRISLPPGFKLP